MGSSNNTAAVDRQINYERQKQEGIDSTVGEINRIYDAGGRQKQYTDFVNALRKQYTTDATRQKTVADRNLKFAMANSGLTGGSVAADSQQLLGEEFQQGLVTAENKAQNALSGLKAEDEAARARMISQAASGLSMTDAATRAGAGMASALEGAKGEALAGGLGDVFGKTAQAYKQQQDRQTERQRMIAAAGGWYSPQR